MSSTTVKIVRNKPAAAPTAPKITGAVAKLLEVEQWTNEAVVGRSSMIRLLTLAAVSRQNVLFLGPPGTAKTMGVLRLAQSFADKPGDVFDILLTKFTKPQEVIGAYDLKALEQGKVRHQTAGFLPSAKVGILDEIFKGSSAILNTLLQLANERTFRNGEIKEVSPLRFIVGMSNEFPDDPAILAAFFDRFPMKMKVQSLDQDDFGSMLKCVNDNGVSKAPPVTLTDKDLTEMDDLMHECEVSDDILDAICEIRAQLAAKGVTVSDRRWAQALKLVRATAVLDGRDSVVRKDLLVLRHVLWNTDADIQTVESILPDYLNPLERQIKDTLDELYAERARTLEAANVGPNKVPNRPSPDFGAAAREAGAAINRCNSIRERVKILSRELAETSEDKALCERAMNSLDVVHKVLESVCLGQGGVAVLTKLAQTESMDL